MWMPLMMKSWNCNWILTVKFMMIYFPLGQMLSHVFQPINRSFLANWLASDYSVNLIWKNRAYQGFHQLTEDAYSWLHLWFIQSSVFTQFLICNSFYRSSLDDYSLSINQVRQIYHDMAHPASMDFIFITY
jgi:hypothetical protein